ncbi:Sec63-domain-containing protein, partial [Acaromyces ingoldii]
MALSSHLDWLLSSSPGVAPEEEIKGKGQEDVDIDTLYAALLSTSSSERNQAISADSALDLPEDVIQDEVPVQSLWDQLLDAAGQIEASEAEDVDGAAATVRLRAHVDSRYAGDLAIRASMIESVKSALEGARNDEEVSIVLAETLGFDHLDLVRDLVAQRGVVVSDLSAAPSARSFLNGSAGTSTIKTAASSRGHHAEETRSTAKPYTPGSSFVIQTAEDKALAKQRRNEHRRQRRARGQAHASDSDEDEGALPFSLEEMDKMRAEELAASTSRPLFSSQRQTDQGQPQYPHVFSSNTGGGNVLSAFGSRFSLPPGTVRVEESFFEELTIPAPHQVPMRDFERRIPISEMDELAKGAFPGYDSLNRLQSAVYPLGYKTNENLLVCAPTGAGKTDVAMLAVLRCISQYADEVRPAKARAGTVAGTNVAPQSTRFQVRLADFKIIYVAPMKALASEIVRKFSKRLAYLGVKVRELTGDMQLTRKEINETQMIVTTPEKWDVVTRKPTGEGELASKVKLLIIDEVHLLHEDRGAVIETIVARTLRLVESSQSLIRIVGLSATLPNYTDVADFLRVNRYQGLFFFDSSFRPIPLEQHFLGVKGKVGSALSRQNHDKATFEKLSVLLEEGHQVMIFVHARKETVKTASTMREMCKEEGLLELLLRKREEDPESTVAVNTFKRELAASRNREVKELFETGFGIHHAGMLRSDRNLSERMFEAGITRVLCCTSTLAWGVNLPAYAVVIKGTQVYDSGLGRFNDLSILDVLQIFGRAGRPQFEKKGVGYIVTTHDKLSHYVDAVTSQHPIESKFKTGLYDALNAEVALGSVSSINDGVAWLSYTYLFTRMRRNPLAYGMTHDEVVEDPQLGLRRVHEIKTAAKHLVACKMLEMTEDGGKLTITDLGRVAAKYYVSYKTIEIFNEKLRCNMSEADALAVLSMATDFEQILPRDNEVQELKRLEQKAPCEVKGACETSAGKTSVLLQAFISREYIDDFALVSDAGYVAQNAGRIIRALFEIALARKWSPVTSALMGMTKAVERRMWPFDHPLSPTQSNLTPELVTKLKRYADDVPVPELAKMSAAAIGDLCKANEREGRAIGDAARSFPSLSIQWALKPVAHDLLQINVEVGKDFAWDDRKSGSMEPFYIWVESDDGQDILKHTRVLVHPSTTTQTVTFVIDVPEAMPAGVTIRWASDRWIGSEDEVWVPFKHVSMPRHAPASTRLLDLPLLSTETCLDSLSTVARSYANDFRALNAVQTQAFHSFMHSSANILFSAPPASGKSTLAEMAIWRTVRIASEAKGNTSHGLTLVLHPDHHQALWNFDRFNQRAASTPDVQCKLARSVADFASVKAKTQVIFTSPYLALKASLDGLISQERLRLVIAEDLHLIDATYELALMRLRRMVQHNRRQSSDARLIGTTASLSDASTLAEALDVDEDKGYYAFEPTQRPSPLRLTLHTFDLAHSATLLKAMVKPAYDRLSALAKQQQAIVFVPSRAQCAITARDLIRQSASELQTRAFLGGEGGDEDTTLPLLETRLGQLKDANLVEPLLNGVGIIVETMSSSDRRLVSELFEAGTIRLLVVSRESVWSLHPALSRRVDLAVVMGAQYTAMQEGARRTVNYSTVELLRMSSMATGPSASTSILAASSPPECLILCQTDQASLLRRSIGDEGVFLESDLLVSSQSSSASSSSTVLSYSLLCDFAHGRIASKVDVIKMLQWSFLVKAMRRNPTFYGCRSGQEEGVDCALSDLVDATLDRLSRMG